MLEIERKYLLKPDVLPLVQNYCIKSLSIEQYYTKVTPEMSVRYRRCGDAYFKTVKRGKGGIRQEWEKAVSKRRYHKHMYRRIGSVIVKNRCWLEVEGTIFTLDSYDGVLRGLYLLEVEFKDVTSFEHFTLPEPLRPYVVKEVTEDEVYKNKNLALFSLPVQKESTSQLLRERLFTLYDKIRVLHEALLQNRDDEEVLHRFRVAVRTSVSLLGSCRIVCDEKLCVQQRERLKTLIDVTNTKRDYDVLKSSFGALVGHLHNETMKQASKRLLHEIEEKIGTYDLQIAQALSSEAYRQTMVTYGDFLRAFPADTIYANYAAKRVCGYVIYRRFAKIAKKIKKQKHLHEQIEMLHKLRIDFKKVRYLLENFAFLFTEIETASVFKQVKKMQTLLGDFHDLHRQKEIYRDIAEETGDHEVRFLIENVIVPALAKKEARKSETVREKLKRFIEAEKKAIRYFATLEPVT